MTPRPATTRPPTFGSPLAHLDPYVTPGTITLGEYRRGRARAGDVHVVRPMEATTAAPAA